MEKSERLKELDKEIKRLKQEIKIKDEEIERLKKKIEEKKERKSKSNSKCIYNDELIEYDFDEFSMFYE